MAEWERLPDETAKQYQAFCIYREMPTDTRSIDAAYCAARGYQAGSRRATFRWFNWSRSNDWVKRAAAYDDYRREQERIAEEQERLKARKERKQIIRNTKAIAGKAQERVMQQIANGEPVSIGALTNLIKMLLEQERAEYNDLPTQRGSNLNVDVSNLTNEQLERIANGEEILTVLATSSES